MSVRFSAVTSLCWRL